MDAPHPSPRVVPVPGMGAEDVLVGPDGRVYTGTEDGAILAVTPDGLQVRRVGRTPGRPLGLEWLPDGRILVCDAHEGLLALDLDGGRLEPLLTHVGGRRMVLCNNAAVDDDGTIYFSDSSTRFPVERWKADVVEDTRTGRLLRRDPDGGVEVLLEGLRFANGVALAADRSFVCVAESSGRTVVRRWLTGPRAGEVDHLARDLPGYPDNIALGTDGLIWVAVATPVNPALERLLHAPRALRSVVWRLPEPLQPKVARTARVLALDAEGRTVHDRELDARAFHMVTGVREHHGEVWLGSLVEPAVAVFTL
jgi:sugar lactone lactonase YvrE